MSLCANYCPYNRILLYVITLRPVHGLLQRVDSYVCWVIQPLLYQLFSLSVTQVLTGKTYNDWNWDQLYGMFRFTSSWSVLHNVGGSVTVKKFLKKIIQFYSPSSTDSFANLPSYSDKESSHIRWVFLFIVKSFKNPMQICL